MNARTMNARTAQANTQERAEDAPPRAPGGELENAGPKSFPLAAERLADRIQDVDEITLRAHLAHQRNTRQRLHLLGADVVETACLLVLAEVFPRRIVHRFLARGEQRLRARVSEEEEFAPVEPQDLAQSRYDFVGWVTLAGFQMPDVRGGGLDAAGDLLLR